MSQNQRSLVFLVTNRYWLIYLVSPVAILFFSGLLALKYAASVWPGMLLWLAALAAGIWVWQNARHNRVDVLPDRVRVRVFRYQFEATWKEIQAMTLTRTGLARGITFYMADGSEYIAGRYFDYEKLVHSIQQHIPLEVQDPLAYQRLGPYQAWRSTMAARYGSPDLTMKVDIGFGQRMLSIALFAFSCVLIWLAAVNRATGWIGPAGLLAGVSLFWLVDSFQTLHVHAEGLAVATLMRRYEIDWHEVQKILYNPDLHVYMLMKKHTRVLLPAPTGWFGKEKKDALEWIRYKIHTSGMVPREQVNVLLWRNHQDTPRRRQHSTTR